MMFPSRGLMNDEDLGLQHLQPFLYYGSTAMLETKEVMCYRVRVRNKERVQDGQEEATKSDEEKGRRGSLLSLMRLFEFHRRVSLSTPAESV